MKLLTSHIQVEPYIGKYNYSNISKKNISNYCNNYDYQSNPLWQYKTIPSIGNTHTTLDNVRFDK